MAATPVLISVEEYLSTSYRPDCDYIDGAVQERNVGEVPHARVLGIVVHFLATHEDEWQIEVLPGQRLQINPTRYRIPDVLAAAIPNTDALIVRIPPLLCVEILASEDRMREVQKRVTDYARMGVPATWVIDPWRYTAFQSGPDGILHPVDAEATLTVPNSSIAIAVPEIFAELDRLEKRSRLAPTFSQPTRKNARPTDRALHPASTAPTPTGSAPAQVAPGYGSCRT